MDDEEIQAMRSRHAEQALTAAVSAGRITQAEADEYLERIRASDDPHAVRRALRRAGVL